MPSLSLHACAMLLCSVSLLIEISLKLPFSHPQCFHPVAAEFFLSISDAFLCFLHRCGTGPHYHARRYGAWRLRSIRSTIMLLPHESLNRTGSLQALLIIHLYLNLQVKYYWQAFVIMETWRIGDANLELFLRKCLCGIWGSSPTIRESHKSYWRDDRIWVLIKVYCIWAPIKRLPPKQYHIHNNRQRECATIEDGG